MQQVSFQRAFLPPNHSNNIYPEEAECLPHSDPESCLHKSTDFSEIMLSTKKMVSLLMIEICLQVGECMREIGMWPLWRVHWADLPKFLLSDSLLALSTMLLTMLSFCISTGAFLVNIFIVQCIPLKDGKMVSTGMWQFFKVFYSKFRIWGDLRLGQGILQRFGRGEMWRSRWTFFRCLQSSVGCGWKLYSSLSQAKNRHPLEAESGRLNWQPVKVWFLQWWSCSSSLRWIFSNEPAQIIKEVDPPSSKWHRCLSQIWAQALSPVTSLGLLAPKSQLLTGDPGLASPAPL